MKRFQFSLQAVLTLRQREEQTALAEYASAQLDRQEVIERLEQIRMALARVWEEMQTDLATGGSAVQVAHSQTYCLVLEEKQCRTEDDLRRSDILVREAHERLLLARRQREVVEKFYDQKKKAYDRELDREEQKAIEDIVGRRSAAGLLWSGSACSWN